MAQKVIAENAHISSVTYTLPNKHYLPVDMGYIGIDNLTPSVHSFPAFLVTFFDTHTSDRSHRANAEVFMPVSAPR